MIKKKSLNKNDFEYFKEFKNISILYNKDLHAKHYCNEKEGLITSLNLYDYSMLNNIEYGVHFSKNILNPTDKLFEETEVLTDDLIYRKSEAVFIKKPQYKKKMFGLTKSFQNSVELFNISDDFFKGRKYKIKHLEEFKYEEYSDLDEVYKEKPQREEKKNNSTESFSSVKNDDLGYCIRTGIEITYNPEQPLSRESWKVWNQYGDPDFPEKYCHKTGKKSYGKTSMNRPILRYK